MFAVFIRTFTNKTARQHLTFEWQINSMTKSAHNSNIAPKYGSVKSFAANHFGRRLSLWVRNNGGCLHQTYKHNMGTTNRCFSASSVAHDCARHRFVKNWEWGVCGFPSFSTRSAPHPVLRVVIAFYESAQAKYLPANSLDCCKEIRTQIGPRTRCIVCIKCARWSGHNRFGVMPKSVSSRLRFVKNKTGDYEI